MCNIATQASNNPLALKPGFLLSRSLGGFFSKAVRQNPEQKAMVAYSHIIEVQRAVVAKLQTDCTIHIYQVCGTGIH